MSDAQTQIRYLPLIWYFTWVYLLATIGVLVIGMIFLAFGHDIFSGLSMGALALSGSFLSFRYYKLYDAPPPKGVKWKLICYTFGVPVIFFILILYFAFLMASGTEEADQLLILLDEDTHLIPIIALFAFVIHSLFMWIGISGGIRFYQNQQKKKVRASE